MDVQQSIESPRPTEEASMPRAGQPGTPSLIGTSTIVVQGDADDQPTADYEPEDIENGDDAQAQDSDSEVDDGGSDYIPTEAQGEEDSDHDVPFSRKKQAKSLNVSPLAIEELHEEWSHWEGIYSGLLIKRGIKTLSKLQNNYLVEARNQMEKVFEKVPISDGMKYEYAKTLGRAQFAPLPEARKRKNDAAAAGQVKKGRLENAAQGWAITRKAKSQTTTKQASAGAISQHFRQIEEQAIQSGAHSKRSKIEVKNMKKALQAFGGEKLVELKDGCWLIRGMKTPLFGYQFDGAGWMVQQERNRDNPNGGILADEMGCGKTITMLSVILRGKPAQKAAVKSNLLLVQSDQMANQWMDQIDKHCSQESLPASRWARKCRLNAAVVGADQIILITYSEVERAWSRVSQSSKKTKKGGAGNAATDQEHLLFRTKFHRMILDECQQIKNHNSQTAKAVFQLTAKYQWLLSATPAPNREDEYYSYLKILQLPNTETIRAFHKYWTNKLDADRPNELEKGLERFLLRRTRDTLFAGVKIFDGVPDSIEDTLTLALSVEERIFYNVVVEPLRTELKMKKEQLARKKIRTLKDTVDENSENGAYMVSKILSLYKLTAHPFLLESIMVNDKFSLGQLQEIRNKLKDLKSGTQSTFLEQAEQIAGHIVENVEAGRSMSLESHLDSIASQSVAGSSVFNVDLQMDWAMGGKAEERKCHMCPGVKIPISAVLTECGHYFCQRHFDSSVQLSKLDHPDDPTRCQTCEQLVGEIENVDQTDLAAAYDTYKATEAPGSRRKGRVSKAKGKEVRRRGDDFNGCQPKGERSRFLELSDKNHVKVPFVHSSKTQEILKIILRWQDDAPGDKIIVFTQWLVMGRIIGRILEDAGISYLYYFGDMTSTERNQSLRTFETEKDVNVIIMGFKCASQGLDMPHANRVILVDPWWNEDGERQAFARVLRKVQTKKTFFIRLIIKESIDMRISDIQQSKRELTERLMKEDDPWRREMIGLEYASKILDQATKVSGEGPEYQEGEPDLQQQEEPKSDADGNDAATGDSTVDKLMNHGGSTINKKRMKISIPSGSRQTTQKPAVLKPEMTRRVIKQEDTSDYEAKMITHKAENGRASDVET